MAKEVLSIEVVAELSGLRKQLSQVGDLTAGKAESLVIGLEKRIKSAQKAAKDAADASKAAAKATSELKQGFASAAKFAASFGGSIGALGSTVNSAASAVAEMAGSAGLGGFAVAGGIATAAIAAVAYGTYEAAQAVDQFVLSAEPALAHLRQLGEASDISPSAIAAIDAYKHATDAAGDSSEQLHVETAGLAASLLGPGRTALTGAESLLSSLATAETHARDNAVEAVTGYKTLGDALHALAASGPLGILIRVGDETSKIGEQARNAAGDVDYLLAQAEAEDEARRKSAAGADAAIAKRKAEEKAAAAQARADFNATRTTVDNVERGVDSLHQAADSYYADTLTPQQQLIADHQKEVDQIDEKTAALYEALTATKALSGAEALRLSDAIDGAAEEAKASADAELERKQATLARETAEQQAADASNARFYADLQKATDAIDASIVQGTAILAKRAAFTEFGAAVAEGIGTAADALTGLAKDGSNAQKALFYTAKAAALGTVGVNYGVALSEASTLLPPLDAIKAAEASVQFAAALAQVAGSTFGSAAPGSGSGSGGSATVNRAPAHPPVTSHPSGGSIAPDHYLAAVQPGEAVVSQRGLQTIERINSGQNPGGWGGAPRSFELRFGAASLGRVMVESLRRGGEARDLVSTLAGARAAVAGHRR